MKQKIWLVKGCGLDCNGGGVYPNSCIAGGAGAIAYGELTTRSIPHPSCPQYLLTQVLLDGVDNRGWTLQPSSVQIEFLGYTCADDECKIDCPSLPLGFCCIQHSLTLRLLQVLQN